MLLLKWSRIRNSISIPIRIGVVMLLVFLTQESFNLDFGILGILPRNILGLFGIIISPWIHGSLLHLVSNLTTLLVLTSLLYYFYDRIAGWVLVHGMLWTNVIVWIAARPYLHIGSSGVVYMLAFFLMGFGIFRGNWKDLLISVAVIACYGSLVSGLVPTSGRISWESHLIGAGVGIVMAFYLSRKRKVSSYAVPRLS